MTMKDRDQPRLFDDSSSGEDAASAARLGKSSLPQGFHYQPDLITPDEERELVGQIETLPFKEFEFHGFTGKRRVVSFGWRYDFDDRELLKADDFPPFLSSLRDKAAAFAGRWTRMETGALLHVLVTEYREGAAIGWHRDKAVFAEVVGVSLLSPARFRLRRQRGTKWERAEVRLAPRSVYLMSGPARTEWEHSIPGVEALRYSITFRSFPPQS